MKQNNKSSQSAYSVGDRVKHNIFGTGTIISVKPMGNDCMLEIAFDINKMMKLMANFAALEKI